MLGLKTRAAAALAGPPFPDRLGYLWDIFLVVSAGLPSGGWGYPTITWEALAAWSALTGTPIAPWEAETLVRLGLLRANIAAEKPPDGHPHPHRPTRSGRP